ncbi:GntR family transcriptional regulator [Agrobacterium fabacearum CFBP 5771]|jgi:DNA-binding GntR family transcriptional regulator|uniref:GntR family transcriptional regulator n=1 Tax=Agrobacterium tumefaciens TaxID=358 RepID=A0A4D7Z2A9_AGRTU|nr:GntR family transcriptional regulator [Agrobacterium tumefaciens]QCL98082.1 GntR family transcriptional regulator [Agrobacterium tumefaciens]CVI23630.1 GntR family transcriptional regulator [Agrobacterium fabacearum CFBP 5771]
MEDDLKVRDETFLVGTTVARIRSLLISGELRAGEKLSEQIVANQLAISRNTLREAFRLLTAQGLLTHIPNRGVYVTAADEAAIIDIFRIRFALQTRALQLAYRNHPGVTKMRNAADAGEDAAKHSDWKTATKLNLEFHRAMVTICDSPRINTAFDHVLIELSLLLGRLGDSGGFHDPFLSLNREITSCLEVEDNSTALALLETYLLKSERALLGAIQRIKSTTDQTRRTQIDLKIGRH